LSGLLLSFLSCLVLGFVIFAASEFDLDFISDSDFVFVLSDLALSGVVLSGVVLSGLVLFYFVLSCIALPCLALSCLETLRVNLPIDLYTNFVHVLLQMSFVCKFSTCLNSKPIDPLQKPVRNI
jgi:hypothetical protein